MELAYIIFGAFLLDWIFGDPRVSFHPVALIGGMALKLEKPVRKTVKNEFTAGMFCSLTVALIFTGAAYSLVKIFGTVSCAAGIAAAVFCVYISIALKSLLIHAKAVEKPLKMGNLDKARRKTAMIVSRDTDILDEQGIIRSCLESIGENIIDGVTAAIFWAALGWYCGGAAGAAAAAVFYRAANTLDATFGYKNKRYRRFGTFPARLDDILNYIPARLTLVAIYFGASISGLRAADAVRCAWRDRKKHPSPNSCWGMAAFAGALGVQLGGPTRYKGEWKQYPYWGIKHSELNINHIGQAKKLAVLAAVIFSALMLTAVIL
ncbi:MAG: adenosylcobinamide-phosphate synthase CbiB [Victivallaceae bacterium]|nr:adenosylcobinamide-phosphate synthase CbiB [Victivallaceae bacterium]